MEDQSDGSGGGTMVAATMFSKVNIHQTNHKSQGLLLKIILDMKLVEDWRLMWDAIFFHLAVRREFLGRLRDMSSCRPQSTSQERERERGGEKAEIVQICPNHHSDRPTCLDESCIYLL